MFLALLLNAFARESLENDKLAKDKAPSKFSQVVSRLYQVTKFGRNARRRTQIIPSISVTDQFGNEREAGDGSLTGK